MEVGGVRAKNVRALTAAAALVLSAGCRTGGSASTAPLATTPNGAVVPAAASAPADPGPGWGLPALPGFGKPAKPQAAPPGTLVVLWRNKIDYLPDPGRNGEMSPGLVGQMFLLGARDQFVPADGTLTVALYDESPRPPGQPANLPEGWEFKKEALRGLRTQDERFGLSYAVFLPWPTYRPDVTRVRIAAKFEPDGGGPLWAQEIRITIDTSAPGAGGGMSAGAVPPVGPAVPAAAWGPTGGPPPSAAGGPGQGVTVTGARAPAPPAAPVVPLPPPTATLDRAPANYGSLSPPGPVAPVGPGPLPPGLPPIVITAGRPNGP
ncbi:MAG: hypothetical protein C0501_13795 [Isosphaera sp.]|nr:hypothetical protein [Isosphaera sp.]